MALVKHSDVKPTQGTPGIEARHLASKEAGAASSGAYEVVLQPGAVVPRHYHDVDSVIVFLEGTFEASQGDNKWMVGPGYTLVSGPGVVHGLRNAGSTVARMLTFHPALEHRTVPEE